MSNISSSLLAERISYISDQYQFYVSVLIMSAGLLSNIFIILILTQLRIFRDNQCAFYLTVECSANIGLLLTVLISRILTYIFGNDPMNYSLVWCKIRTWLLQVFGLISLFTICFATFDQYLSTNYHYSIRKLSSLKLAYILTIINICFSILHNISLLIFTDIQTNHNCTIYHLIFKRYFSLFYYPILAGLLPVMITSTFSILAYYNVRHLIRLQISLNRRRLDKQLTAMILARVICLVFLGLPYIIYLIYTFNVSIDEQDSLRGAIVKLIRNILVSVFYANYSINFYIFLLISSRFRHQVKYFLTKKFCHCIKSNRIIPKTNQHTISVVDLE